ncbi:hypothetical protein EB796_003441 [Bugula neritina]|uniref:Uncharacterized protein n=1 Tax=Bugula neritina TaxID=10212 RepID=A0A7J7KK62_BUGNE|nr:hypothetical protein EB796_003441 [Bugula neritina]
MACSNLSVLYCFSADGPCVFRPGEESFLNYTDGDLGASERYPGDKVHLACDSPRWASECRHCDPTVQCRYEISGPGLVRKLWLVKPEIKLHCRGEFPLTKLSVHLLLQSCINVSVVFNAVLAECLCTGSFLALSFLFAEFMPTLTCRCFVSAQVFSSHDF